MPLFHIAAGARRPSPGPAGLALTELIITCAVVAGIFSTGASMIVSHIKQTSIEESNSRLQNEWGRINYFIDSEINEAASASVVPNTSLTLTLPTGQTITYSFDAATHKLTRTGPPIRNNGRRDLSSSSSVEFLSNINAFTPSLTNNREPAYGITLRDARGRVFSGFSSSARTRTTSYP
jgi:hypothetical protein